MDHDSNATRIAALFIFALVGYWAFVEAESNESAPSRVGPGTPGCSVTQQLTGNC